MFLGSSLISWKCKKQVTVSKSSAEVEYRSVSSASNEVLWLHRLLREFGVPIREATPLNGDNTSAIQIASNLVFHERTKHIEVDCHFIRQHFLSRLLFLPHVSSHNQLADLFAKALPRPRHDFLVTKLMLSHNPHQFGGKCKDEKPDPVHKSSPGLTFCIMYSLSHSSGP
eukprot:TRINITY_DN27257_c0_g1_i2.p1 TRINITY_DN27257_c0_g1~~TRINITY_DN27257_c0_g1_i2.p1  ORF type:complete len:170 (+),score=20.05 TRINITY_DN27257_c0_g1_i2:270-779(+)